MKTAVRAVMTTVLCATLDASAQDRTPVQDARPLLIAAIDAPSGEAHGLLVGEIADAVTQRFKGTSPIYIDVTTERRYAQPGCRRLNDWRTDRATCRGRW